MSFYFSFGRRGVVLVGLLDSIAKGEHGFQGLYGRVAIVFLLLVARRHALAVNTGR